MPGTNLTRDEAAARAALLDVHSYDVHLDLTTGPVTFRSTTVLRFGAEEGAESFADLVGGTVHEVTLNGVAMDPAEVYAESRLRLTGLAAVNELRVVADLRYSRTGEGLHRFVDPADDRVYLYSQCEVPDARRIYTTFEQPDLKAVFRFTVTAPAHWKVVSNAATPTPEPVPGGTAAVWRFPATEPMSTYVTAVVAGEYHEVLDTYSGKHGDIPLGHYCRQSVVEHLDVDELVRITRQGFDFFEDAFDYPYPFGKYDQLYVPEFNNGAMENAGCVTFRDEYLPRSQQARWFYEQRANTILHEMAHMWFGDLVTMRWWDDLWLNESFAEWAATHAAVQATAYGEAWTGFANSRKNWAYRQDQLPSTHPIAADNHDLEAVEVNFDGITYAKGASALKQLVAYVGEQPFLEGLRAYFRRHAFGNSEFADLLSALEETSGRDLDSWARAWLKTSGVNTLRARMSVDDAGAYRSFTVEQTASPDFPTLRPHRIGIGLYDRVAGRLVCRSRFETDLGGASTEVAALVGEPQPDLLLLNDGDLSYAKIRLDDRSLTTVLESLGTLEDSLARALCWGAVWDMTRDAEIPARDFITLVLSGLAVETDDTAVKQLPVYAQIAIEQFADPASRQALRTRWERGFWELLRGAEPGSGRQLTFLKCFAGGAGRRMPPSSYSGAARSPAALAYLAGLLDGSERLEGLDIDADLRWTILIALASAGVADRDRIAAELREDHTIAGQERAAAAMAVLPEAAAKEEAWLDATTRDGVANETQRSITGVWDAAGQEHLLAPYLERYLRMAETIWEDRGTQIASTALEFMFPRALTSEATLARVDEWLATAAVNPAARRYVGEARADMARALAAQRRDAAAG